MFLRNFTQGKIRQTASQSKVMSHLLLEPVVYNPDTLNLNDSPESKTYWFLCFQDLIGRLSKQASKSCTDDDAEIRAEKLKQYYIKELTLLQDEKNNSEEPLTIRKYLDLHEHCLRLFNFVDPWKEQKAIENDFALIRLKSRLIEIDKLEGDERWIEIAKGLLAGNLFDWGCSSVSMMLEKNKSFGLTEAVDCIQKRPWVIDDLDDWLSKMRQPQNFKCCAIFADNSGVDVVLGILPFAREMLRRGTKVLLCANQEPALNDITHKELLGVIERCCLECQIIKTAYETGQLQIHSNGQSGPCLDFRQLPEELNIALIKHECDLIVIEGMGRALHTNLHAKFKCDVLKCLVIKNQWLAKNLFDSGIFSVIFKYERGGTHNSSKNINC
ncbi:4'-phosphopantetheine phosphatase [Culicoides brevitarsis]|uniref:4'-phosphopantetheine phosphatase n=1 Tax=Culicoides brevitarsis TaxID=469753 RepID=UPI00307B5B27